MLSVGPLDTKHDLCLSESVLVGRKVESGRRNIAHEMSVVDDEG